MNFIDELLKDEKVEWKKLGEVCLEKFWIMPATPRFVDKGIPYITGKNIKNGEIDYKNVKYISKEIYDSIAQNRNIRSGDILVSMIGTIGEIGIVRENIDFYGQNLYLLRLNKDFILNRYFFHYFTQIHIKDKLISKKNSSSQGYIRAGQLEELKIPIPSLETQEKIVKILDNFTKYVTELQAELQSRNKQYNYYRDMLLSEEYLNKISEKFTENQFIEWKMLGELFEFKNGLNKGKDFFGKGTPIINYMDVYKRNKIYSNDLIGLVETTEDEQKRYSIKRGDVFFTRTSETKEEIGKTSVLLDDVEKGVFSGFVLRARPITELLLPEYCAYCFETYEFRKNVIRYSTYTTRALTNGTTLSNLEMPVPPIEIQNKIVKILDRFQELLSDTKGLLPLEIEQRRKQYEYYREKLLTFGKEEGYALSTAQHSTAQHSTATNNE